MNISPVNASNASFGKISWGTPERAETTEKALISLKEANDIDGDNLLKYNDVTEQLKALSEHTDTFEVTCSTTAGKRDAYFTIRVFEEDGRTLIDSFEKYYTSAYKNGVLETSPKNDINYFAQNVFNKHKLLTIKSDVKSFMSKFGKVEQSDSNKTNF